MNKFNVGDTVWVVIDYSDYEKTFEVKNYCKEFIVECVDTFTYKSEIENKIVTHVKYEMQNYNTVFDEHEVFKEKKKALTAARKLIELKKDRAERDKQDAIKRCITFLEENDYKVTKKRSNKCEILS